MRDIAYKGTRDERGFSRKTNGLESNCAAVLKRLETVCQHRGVDRENELSLPLLRFEKPHTRNFSRIIAN